MGILSNESEYRKSISMMIRLPSAITELLDGGIGLTHSSRPDFVTDGIRSFLHYICVEEKNILDFLEKKEDASREVKIQFYYETIKLKTELYRKTLMNAAEQSKKKDVDILLSLPIGLVGRIENTVNRTKCFRNRQEFVKAATVFVGIQYGLDNEVECNIENFLESNQSTKEIEEQIAKMREEMISEKELYMDPFLDKFSNITNEESSQKQSKSKGDTNSKN